MKAQLLNDLHCLELHAADMRKKLDFDGLARAYAALAKVAKDMADVEQQDRDEQAGIIT